MNLGFVGIIIEGDKSVAASVQLILTEFSDLIVGRMGLPNLAHKVCMITVGVQGEPERIPHSQMPPEKLQVRPASPDVIFVSGTQFVWWTIW